jgi:uncharacterized protein YdeI (YjbR/CyaY-like superfamily)
MQVIYFPTAADFRAWLEEHHQTVDEVWVGFYKKSSGKPTITYAEAVDEALCFGWIDGIRRSVDDESYTNRFTPRRSKSNWSQVNTKRVGELTEQGRMEPAGLKAFQERDLSRSQQYSFENRPRALDPPHEATFRASQKAWNFFQAQPPWYRRTAIWWVVSAKQEATRLRRLTTLIDDSENGRRLRVLTSPARKRESPNSDRS